MPSVFGTVAAVEGVNTQTPSGAVNCGADADRVLLVLLVSGDTTTHGHPNAPTYNAVAMTQVGTIIDLRNGNSTDGNRMASLWRLDDPASGSNTLTVDMGASRTQTSMIPVPCSAADTVGASSRANDSSGTSNTPTITDTPNNADSLLLGLAAGDAGNIDPYTPVSGTEIWDSGSGTLTNHSSWAASLTGSGAQTFTTTQSANGEWAIWFVEVTAVSAATFTGSAAVTEGPDTSTASGTHTAPTFTGTATPTEGADTSTASGTFVPGTLTGSASPTEGADTSTASGTFVPGTLTGTAAPTEGADVSAASGTFVAPDITGTAAPTEGADVASATGTVVNPEVDHEPNPSEADSNTGAASAPPVNVPLGAVLAATGTSAAVPVTGKSLATVGDSGGTA